MSTSSCEKTFVRFTTRYNISNTNHVIGVTGSYKYLGSWDPKHALLLQRRGNKGCWSSVVKLPLSKYFEWKLIVIDKKTLTTQKWEEYPNRWNWIDRGPVEIIVGWNSKELIRCSSCRCLVGTCCCTTIYTKLAPIDILIDVTFRAIYSLNTDHETMALIGSSRYLGNWDPTVSRLFSGHENPVLTIQLPMNKRFEWKLAILDRRERKTIRCEECKYRVLKLQTCPLEVGVAWNQAEKIGYKCYWMDPHWVVSPCPCGKRYCLNAGSSIRDQTKKLFSSTVRSSRTSPVRELSTKNEDCKSGKREKNVLFSENPVTQVFEHEKIDVSLADSLQELNTELDNSSIDKMLYNKCFISHKRSQIFELKAKSSDIESCQVEITDQEMNFKNIKTVAKDLHNENKRIFLPNKFVESTDEGSLSHTEKTHVKHANSIESLQAMESEPKMHSLVV